MAFTGIDGSNTFCDSGQDILSSALLPGCTANQQVIFDGSKFVCEDKTSVPTCPDNQVLTFLSGTGFTCVNANAQVPTCTANQFLTYSNNTFQCANVQQITWPTCGPNQVGSFNGSAPVCIDNPSSGGDFAQSTWQDMTGARALDAAYTNDTGHAIEISVSTYSGAYGIHCAVNIFVNGVMATYQFMNNNYGAAMCDTSAIVPAGASYVVGNDGWWDIGLYHWAELR
jgi:hypothetical protein